MKKNIIILFLIIGIFIRCSQKGPDISYLENAEKDTLIEVVPMPEKAVIRMQKWNTVYILPVLLNDCGMDMVFDTGAGDVSISTTEANFLFKQGKLTNEDIIGKANYMDATGKISIGTVIILRKITVAGRTVTNVRATVVGNAKAPLLLGLSALEKFGKVLFDPSDGSLTFL